MLVEISETTLAAIEKFDTQGRTDMSVDQWAEFKMSAVSICNNLHFDVEMTKVRNESHNGPVEVLNTIGNKEEQQ